MHVIHNPRGRKKIVTWKDYMEHPEWATVHNELCYQPWVVTLPVLKSPFDPRVHYTCYYVRAANPMAAALEGRRSWERWEKGDKFAMYPQVTDKAPCESEAIQEHEYAIAWREARKHPHFFRGSEKNPLVFVYNPKDVGLILPP